MPAVSRPAGWAEGTKPEAGSRACQWLNRGGERCRVRIKWAFVGVGKEAGVPVPSRGAAMLPFNFNMSLPRLSPLLHSQPFPPPHFWRQDLICN